MDDATKGIMRHNLCSALLDIQKEHLAEIKNLKPVEGELVRRNWCFDFYLKPQIMNYARWLDRSDETSNFVYAIRNFDHLAGWISAVINCPLNRAIQLINEVISDEYLLATILPEQKTIQSEVLLRKIGPEIYGRRIGWYAIAREVKPRLIVETGVDKGLGSCVLARAIMRNAMEGRTGKYIGTDINSNAGSFFVNSDLSRFGEIRYGDSIESLKRLDSEIDLFINDSDHSPAYEANEYLAVEELLHQDSIILGDNSHVTSELYNFAMKSGRQFLYFQECPLDHWYRGAGIGAAYPQRKNIG